MARKRNEDEGAEEPKRGETVRAVFFAVLIALAIRSFVVEPFKIPSGSMIPTLLVGDYVLVNKFTYGVRLPITGTLLFGERPPERGDVVVFKLPDDPSIDYIKRVVGLPGDTLEIKEFRLYINDELVDRRRDGEHPGEGGESFPTFIERNPEGVEYSTMHDRAPPPKMRDAGPFRVPQGHYFMMGDNRYNSQDSRFWRQHYVDASLIKGKAFMIHWSWVLGDESGNRGFLADLAHTIWKVVTFQVEEVRWRRIGDWVDGVASQD